MSFRSARAKMAQKIIIEAYKNDKGIRINAF